MPLYVPLYSISMYYYATYLRLPNYSQEEFDGSIIFALVALKKHFKNVIGRNA